MLKLKIPVLFFGMVVAAVLCAADSGVLGFSTFVQENSRDSEIGLSEFRPKSQLKAKSTRLVNARYPVIDAHGHFGYRLKGDADALSSYVKTMDDHLIAMSVSLDVKLGDEEAHLSFLNQEQGERFLPFAHIDFQGSADDNDYASWACNKEGFVRCCCEQLVEARKKGVVGVKFFKQFGLGYRNADGSLIEIDDPRFDPFWRQCGQLKMPVLIHTGDPAAFFEPIDATNERYEELSRHPDWSFHGSEYPSREDLLAARNRVIARHPGTNFIGAHVAGCPENLEQVATWLKKYPNLYVEIASRIAELGRQPFTARKFFIDYQDRILFGTDGPWPELRLTYYWRFLETEDEYFPYSEKSPPPQGLWQIFGVNLPAHVLQKIYFQNFLRLIPAAKKRYEIVSRKLLDDNYYQFVIPGDDSSDTVTSFANGETIQVDSSFVKVEDGQFRVDGKRKRFWGVNLCFGANFPTHEEADKIAPHFAKLGINCVRFHHMDMQNAPNGIWQLNADGTRSFDKEQIDRLDYFLAKLHENGIYANLNLHVSRTLSEAEGVPKMESGPWWAKSNKWVMYYDPTVQRYVKEYCRELLNHRNPYRNSSRRADDPGVALVEMLNENYFTQKGLTILDSLPQQHVDSFAAAWNRWLQKQYRSTQEMVSRWSEADIPPGELLVSSAAWATGKLGRWTLNQQADAARQKFKSAKSDGVNEQSVLRIEPRQKFEQAHFLQLTRRNLNIVQGQAYTMSFWVRADAPREFNMEVSATPNDEWRPIGVFETVKANAAWRKVSRTFLAKETQPNGYIAFSLGTSETPIEFSNVQLQEGSVVEPLPKGQDLAKANIGIPKSGWSIGAHKDLKRFMVDQERSWIVELRDYLRNDLGVKVPITASQENYHVPGLLAETVDFIDLHNYWNHPTFPAGKDFNPTDYRTGNEPMEDDPTRSSWPTNSLLMRTGWRYKDMPFTLSEWNHSEPSDVSSGAVMTGAAIAAIQDWDAVFIFDYEARGGVWFKEHFEGFFEMNSQPVKLATFSVATNIFRRGDLAPLKDEITGTFEDRPDGRLAFSHRLNIAKNPNSLFRDRQKVDELLAESERNFFQTPDRSLTWDASQKGSGKLVIDTKKTQGAWGLIANSKISTASLELDLHSIRHSYGTVVATSLDENSLETSKSILLLASSGAENTDMRWNADRTSVSDQWGRGPTRINLVSGTVSLQSRIAKALKVYALDGKGNRIGQLNAKVIDGNFVFEIGESTPTIWYEISSEN